MARVKDDADRAEARVGRLRGDFDSERRGRLAYRRGQVAMFSDLLDKAQTAGERRTASEALLDAERQLAELTGEAAAPPAGAPRREAASG